MLSFPGSLKVFVALDPFDMRKRFEGLHAAMLEDIEAGQMLMDKAYDSDAKSSKSSLPTNKKASTHVRPL